MKTVKSYMTRSLLLVLTLSAAQLWGQDAGTSIINQKGSVSIMPLYQRWSVKNGPSFSLASAVVSLYQPLGRNASFSLRGSGGSASGDVTKLAGPADAQASINYHWEAAHLVFSLAFNIPSGKKKLTLQEFQTSMLLGNSIFDMRVPAFGTGFNVNPAATWAIPLSDDFVLGLGASYQYKGRYIPVESLGEYDPGDEVLVTGGFDAQVGSAGSFSVDVVFTTGVKDKLAGKDVFRAGNKIVASAQFKQAFGFHELWLLARYRTRAKSEFLLGNAFVTEPEKLEPDNADIIGTFNAKVSDALSILFLLEGRLYQESPLALSGAKLFGVGIKPSVTVSRGFDLFFISRFQYGSLKGGSNLTGIEGGIGMTFSY